MGTSKLDKVYRSILLSRFFVKGWGHPENLKRIFEFRKILSNREECQKLVPSDYPVVIDKEDVQKDCRILTGHFLTPWTTCLPGIMPPEVETAKFEIVLPHKWTGPHKPVCVHLAGTGDHGFYRRRMLMARPLLKEAGIASIILENPYYGYRKPKQQFRSALRNVSDLFVMGGSAIMECLVLFHWCEREGLGPLGVTGMSLGGHLASLAATNWHKPIAHVPCLSWTTASTVFTRGVLADALPWPLLGKQYSQNSVYEKDVSKLIVSPEKDCQNPLYQLGYNFSHDFELLNEAIAAGGSRSGVGAAEKYLGPTLLKFLKLAGADSNTGSSPGASPADLEKLQNEAALHFMRGVMDECTHLANYSMPVDPSMVIIVAGKADAYIPRDNVQSLHELWPGSELRLLDSGHISAFLFNQAVFRKAIADSFDRLIKKYHTDGLSDSL